MIHVRMQRLFAVTAVLKVATAFLGWRFQMPWTLGFGVPLAIMAAYIGIGLNRAADDVSDEKFADTCYYLGFIFTITSIIFSLFDLPNIGTRIQDIAVRFGAAMVSTVFGLGVRVYLVSFRKDGADAVQDVEDAVVEAAHRFREQLVIALEKLRGFEETVDQAARSAVERVNLQVEKLSTDHSLRLQAHFADLAQQNQAAFTGALEEVKAASVKLALSFDTYSAGIQRNLSSIEQKVTAFADAVSERLALTTFPDDYFVRHLERPVQLLQGASKEVANQVLAVSEQVAQSTVMLGAALRKLKTKAEAAESTLESVLALAGTQKALTDSAQEQLSSLQAFRFDEAFAAVVEAVGTQTASGASLNESLGTLIAQEDGIRKEINAVVGELARLVSDTRTAADLVSEKLDKSTQAVVAAADQAGLAAVAVSRVPSHLEVLADATGKKTDILVEQMAAATDQLRDIVRKLEAPAYVGATPTAVVANAVVAPTSLALPVRPTDVEVPPPALNPGVPVLMQAHTATPGSQGR